MGDPSAIVLDVLPRQTPYATRDGHLADPEGSGDRAVGLASVGSASCFCNEWPRQLGLAVRFAASTGGCAVKRAVGVLNVLKRRYVLQVIQPIVLLVAVLVVYLEVVGAGTDERLCYKPMREFASSRPGHSEVHLVITVGDDVWAEHAPSSMPDGAHASERRDIVDAFVACNGKPILIGDRINNHVNPPAVPVVRETDWGATQPSPSILQQRSAGHG